MNKTGLVSITFRNLKADEIIKLVKDNGLDAIEWGSDVHVIPGDFEEAKRIRGLMDEANLETSSYGSYYRVGLENEYSFEDIAKTAQILNAKDIRVWAGRKGSLDADEAYRNNVIEDSKRIADIAFKKGVRVSFEYHGKTLTDTPESALNLLKAVNHPNMKCYWQPAVNVAVEDRIKSIKLIQEYITTVHVFSWNGIERLPLADKSDDWHKYIETINQYQTEDRYFLIEFVKDDLVEQFVEDAKTLKELI